MILIITAIILTGCDFDRESPVYSHLQDQDPTKMHRDDPSPEEKELTTDDPRCLGQYTPEDITYRDMERRAIVENNPNLCVDMPEEPLTIKCPGEVTLIYYSKERCIDTIIG